MPIEPILSLAFSVQSSPGVYALLLGSGLSRAAQIPTGWEVTQDLVRKLAKMKNETCEPDPAAWYANKYGDEPDYSKLLKAIAKTPSDRKELLRAYFEPDNEEQGRGVKQPTRAHRAIAELARGGYIRVIITTNFDRLIEKALEEKGITPTVVSTPDSADGVLPLVHAKTVVIKVHGDYLDTRIKNTPEELSRYDRRIKSMIGRVFDEFGLIVCGWSAEWDTALCASLERCKSFRFATYWVLRGKAGDSAKKLIQLRRADTISVKDANSFFSELTEKVIALETFSRPHPLSTKAAVASLKRYIVDDRYRINLHDMLVEETERLVREMNKPAFSLQDPQPTKDEGIKRVTRYEALAETLCTLFAYGSFWGDSKTASLWAKLLERVANATLPPLRQCFDQWKRMGLYPGLLLLYSAGIAAIAAQHYDTLAALLLKANIRRDSREMPAGLSLGLKDVIDLTFQKQLWDNRYTPLSEHLFAIVGNPLKELLPDEIVYRKMFDYFEYFFCLNYYHLRDKAGMRAWAMPGCFGWRHSETGTVQGHIEAEITQMGENWGPLKAGFFDGSLARLKEVKSGFDQVLTNMTWQW